MQGSCAGWVTRRCCSMGASSEEGTDTTCIPSNGVYDRNTSLLILLRNMNDAYHTRIDYTLCTVLCSNSRTRDMGVVYHLSLSDLYN